MPFVRREPRRARSVGRLAATTLCAGLTIVAAACSFSVDTDGLTGGPSAALDADVKDGTVTSATDAAADANRSTTDGDDSTGDGSPGTGDANAGGEDAADAAMGTDYVSLVLASGPIAYWRFEETSGIIAKSEVNATTYAGAYQGEFVLGAPGALGADGGTSVHLSGATSNDLGGVQIPQSFAFPDNAPFTFEFWFNAVAIDASYRQLFSHGGSAESYALFWEMSSTSPNDIFFAATPTASSSTRYLDSDRQAALNHWTYFVCSYDGAELTMYQDGVVVATALQPVTGTTQDAGATAFDIGTGSSLYNEFYGDIDEFAVYDKALDQATIQAHFAAAGPHPVTDAGASDAGDAGDASKDAH